MTPAFSASELQEALSELAVILQRRGKRARIYVAGGAAMILANKSDKLTRDIDAWIEEGYGAVMDAAQQIAGQRGWPSTWINEQATTYTPPPEKRRGTVVYDHPSLKVIAANNDHLLAMKARAARSVDESDVEQLLRECGYSTVEQVESLVQNVFSDEGLGERQKQWMGAVIDRLTNQEDIEPTEQGRTGSLPRSSHREGSPSDRAGFREPCASRLVKVGDGQLVARSQNMAGASTTDIPQSDETDPHRHPPDNNLCWAAQLKPEETPHVQSVDGRNIHLQGRQERRDGRRTGGPGRGRSRVGRRGGLLVPPRRGHQLLILCVVLVDGIDPITRPIRRAASRHGNLHGTAREPPTDVDVLPRRRRRPRPLRAPARCRSFGNKNLDVGFADLRPFLVASHNRASVHHPRGLRGVLEIWRCR